MSAGILKNDKIVSIAPCWHKMEQLVSSIDFLNSGLNWEVEKRDLFIPCGNDHCKVSNWQAVVRKDLDLVLNIPKTSYAMIQNSRLWEILSNSLVGVNYKVAVTGSLQDCRKVFISIQIDGKQDFVVNGDSFQSFITFVTSHDGSLALESYSTETRVCCMNTLNASRAAKGHVDLKVYHTKNNELKIQDMEKTLEEMFEKREDFYKSLEYLASKPLSLEQCNKLLTGFIGKGEELSTRAENQVNTMLGYFQKGIGNKGQTYYDSLNAVTQNFTHNASENKAKALASNEFGSAGNKKVEFYDILMSDNEIDRLVKQGERLLQANKVQAVTV